MKTKYKYGFTCGAYDLLHYGHVLILKECKRQCDYLIVGLQVSPHLDPGYRDKVKNKPIQTLEERLEVLKAIKYVDEIHIYSRESDLLKLLKKLRRENRLDVQFWGNDWKGKHPTGWNLGQVNVYHDRTRHRWSSTFMRRLMGYE